MKDMGRGRDNEKDVLFECDPGRVLLHASFYVWQQAARFPMGAWLEAQEILRLARNECDDQDRIEFVRRIEQASGNPLAAS